MKTILLVEGATENYNNERNCSNRKGDLIILITRCGPDDECQKPYINLNIWVINVRIKIYVTICIVCVRVTMWNLYIRIREENETLTKHDKDTLRTLHTHIHKHTHKNIDNIYYIYISN